MNQTGSRLRPKEERKNKQAPSFEPRNVVWPAMHGAQTRPC